VRSLILSPTYQKLMATTDYSPSTLGKFLATMPGGSPQDIATRALLAGRAQMGAQ
jgi:hypothetical protein